MDMSGSQNFSVKVTLTGQLLYTRASYWSVKKCFEEAGPQPTDISAVSEGEEEEDTSGVTEVWLVERCTNNQITIWVIWLYQLWNEVCVQPILNVINAVL